MKFMQQAFALSALIAKPLAPTLLIPALLVPVLLVLALGGCATTEVQAWEKSALAKPSMAFDGNVLQIGFIARFFNDFE